jgi:hypothetical protein
VSGICQRNEDEGCKKGECEFFGVECLTQQWMPRLPAQHSYTSVTLLYSVLNLYS